MKKLFATIILLASSILASGQSKVYLTREITPESLVKI